MHSSVHSVSEPRTRATSETDRARASRWRHRVERSQDGAIDQVREQHGGRGLVAVGEREEAGWLEAKGLRSRHNADV